MRGVLIARSLLAVFGLLLLVVCVSAPSAASATTCRTGMPASGVIPGDVIAEYGCVIRQGAEVKGNVKVTPGGSLTMSASSSAITVRGNVESKNAVSIDIEGANASVEIGGNVRIEGTTGTTTVSFANVGRDIEVVKSRDSISVAFNTADDVAVHDNKLGSGFGEIDVTLNTVRGKVDIHNNSLTGPDGNALQIAFGSTAGDLKVHDNDVVGGPGSTNRIEIGSNDADDGDVHNNAAEGGDTNEVVTHDNTLGHNLDVHDNDAHGGASNVVDVSGNTVGKDLDCHGNKPHATSGQSDFSSPNPNTGKKKGECRTL